MRSSLVAAAQNKVKETEMMETVVNCRWEKQIDEHRYRVNVKAEMKKDLAAKKIEKELIDVETKQHDTNVMRVIQSIKSKSNCVFKELNRAPDNGITFNDQGEPLLFKRPKLPVEKTNSFVFALSQPENTKPNQPQAET